MGRPRGGGGCRPRGVFAAALLLLGAACFCCRASAGLPAVATPAAAAAGELPRTTARVVRVRLRKDVPRLAPPAAYFIMVLEVVRPSNGVVTVDLDGHIRRLTAEWFSVHGVRVKSLFAEHIRSRHVVHAHRTVTYILALSSVPPVTTLVDFSHYYGYQLASGAVSEMAAGVRGQRHMGTTVEILAASPIESAPELRAGGTYDESGQFHPTPRRNSRGGFSSTALIGTVCGVLGGIAVVGLGLMLYIRMRGAAAARYSVFHWRGGGDGASDLPSRASRSSRASSGATTPGGARADREWYPSGRRRRSAPSFSASAPAPPERRGASPPLPSPSAGGGGKGGAGGGKSDGWMERDLDDALRVSVASSSSFDDLAPGSMATPVTPPPRAATMPPLK